MKEIGSGFRLILSLGSALVRLWPSIGGSERYVLLPRQRFVFWRLNPARNIFRQPERSILTSRIHDPEPLIRGERLVPTKCKPRYVTAMTQHHDGARSGSSRHRQYDQPAVLLTQIEPQAEHALGVLRLIWTKAAWVWGDGVPSSPA